MGIYIKDEKKLKEQILKILYNIEVDDPAQAMIDESVDVAANNIILLFSTMIRNERLGIKNE
jgi:hypothetical protein